MDLLLPRTTLNSQTSVVLGGVYCANDYLSRLALTSSNLEPICAPSKNNKQWLAMLWFRQSNRIYT